MAMPDTLDRQAQDLSSKSDLVSDLLKEALEKAQDAEVKGLIGSALSKYVDTIKPLVSQLEQAIPSLLMTERLERLERRQDALIEHVEDLEDKIDIDRAKAEMERTGEEPITWEEFEKELDS
jgi:hypothetical protein